MTWGGLSPPYATIVADPPWPFAYRKRHLGYSLMTLEEIAALPVAELAADAAHLYLWVTRDLFREGHGVAVARAWGFAPVGEIIWRKPNFGTGSFPRPGHEPLLVCRRGGLSFAAPFDVHSVQTWGQAYAQGGSGNGFKRHSAKPVAAFDLIEKHSPGPFLELFSRSPRLGWDSWGHGFEVAS